MPKIYTEEDFSDAPATAAVGTSTLGWQAPAAKPRKIYTEADFADQAQEHAAAPEVDQAAAAPTVPAAPPPAKPTVGSSAPSVGESLASWANPMNPEGFVQNLPTTGAQLGRGWAKGVTKELGEPLAVAQEWWNAKARGKTADQAVTAAEESELVAASRSLTNKPNEGAEGVGEALGALTGIVAEMTSTGPATAAIGGRALGAAIAKSPKGAAAMAKLASKSPGLADAILRYPEMLLQFSVPQILKGEAPGLSEVANAAAFSGAGAIAKAAAPSVWKKGIGSSITDVERALHGAGAGAIGAAGTYAATKDPKEAMTQGALMALLGGAGEPQSRMFPSNFPDIYKAAKAGQAEKPAPKRLTAGNDPAQAVARGKLVAEAQGMAIPNPHLMDNATLAAAIAEKRAQGQNQFNQAEQQAEADRKGISLEEAQKNDGAKTPAPGIRQNEMPPGQQQMDGNKSTAADRLGAMLAANQEGGGAVGQAQGLQIEAGGPSLVDTGEGQRTAQPRGGAAPPAPPQLPTEQPPPTVVGGPVTDRPKKSLAGRQTIRQEALDAAAQGDVPPVVKQSIEEAKKSQPRVYREEDFADAPPVPERPGTTGNTGTAAPAPESDRANPPPLRSATPAPAPSGRSVSGNRIQVRSKTDPNKTYDFELRVSELDDLQPSHDEDGNPNPRYPAGLQPRGRGRAASIMQTQGMARTLNPENVQRIPDKLGRGMPHTDQEGNVEGGNGRVMAYRIARRDHPDIWQQYRQRLIDHAADYGIDPAAVAAMQNPTVHAVRMTDVDPQEIARESNATGTMSMSSGENAGVDAGRIPDSFLQTLTVGEDQAIDQALLAAGNRDFVRGVVAVVPEAERAGMMDSAGNLSRTGLARVKAAIFAKVFRGEAGRRLQEKMLESTDPGTRNLENALFASLPQMAEVEGAVAAGTVRPEYSLAGDLTQAADRLVRLRSEGGKVEDYLAQTSLLGEDLTPFQKDILRFMAANPRSAKQLREAVRSYASLVKNLPPPGQGEMFASTPKTKEQLWRDATAGAPARTDNQGSLSFAAESLAPYGGAGAFDWKPTPERGLEQIAEEATKILAADRDNFFSAVRAAGQDLGFTHLFDEKPEKIGNALKSRDGNIKKIRKRGYLPDSLRTTLIMPPGPDPTGETVQRIVDSMQRNGYTVWKNDIDNLYEPRAREKGEYRHLALKFEKNGDDIPRELLVMGRNMNEAKETVGHVAYEVTRSIEDLVENHGHLGLIDKVAQAHAEQMRKFSNQLFRYAYSKDSFSSPLALDAASSSAPISTIAVTPSGSKAIPLDSRNLADSSRELLANLRQARSANLIASEIAGSDPFMEFEAAVEKFSSMSSPPSTDRLSPGGSSVNTQVREPVPVYGSIQPDLFETPPGTSLKVVRPSRLKQIPQEVASSGDSGTAFLVRGQQLRTGEDVVYLFRNQSRYDREVFWLAWEFPDGRRPVVEMVSVGSLSASLVHPREVFKNALRRGATRVWSVHNHPSGNTRPSQEDIFLTERLDMGARALDIEYAGHAIIEGNTYSEWVNQAGAAQNVAQRWSRDLQFDYSQDLGGNPVELVRPGDTRLGPPSLGPKIGGPADVARYIAENIRGVERPHIISLDSAGKVLGNVALTNEDMSSAGFRHALTSDAAAALLVGPMKWMQSPVGRETAKLGRTVGQLLGVPLHDAIGVEKSGGYWSASENGWPDAPLNTGGVSEPGLTQLDTRPAQLAEIPDYLEADVPVYYDATGERMLVKMKAKEAVARFDAALDKLRSLRECLDS